MSVTERQEIKEALRKLALGDEDVSGRVLASRVAALRRLEQITRSDDDGPGETHEERQERLDFPCGPDGKFDPSGSAELWQVGLAFRWRAGDAREAQALSRWEQRGGRREWDLAGRPYAHSQWEVDRGPWTQALAAV